MKEDVLPEGWEIKRFEGVIDIQGGSQPPKSEFIYEEQENYIRLLQIRDFGEKPVPTFVPKNRVSKFCQETDILIARYGASLGRIVTGLSGAYNVALAKTIYDKSVLNDRFVFYLLQTPIFQKPLSMISRSAQNGFAKQDIADIKIPLPPLPEQQYLSQKLTALLDEVAQTKQRLEAIPAQLKQFRQSVLADAVSGRLTEENADKWNTQPLKSLTTKIGSGSTPKGGNDVYKDSGIPFVRSLNIHTYFIKYEDLVFIDEVQAEKLKNVKIKENDVLLNITGASIGRVNIAPKEFVNGRVNQHVAIIRLKQEVILPKFLHLILASPKFQKWIEGENYGTTRQALTKGMLETLEIHYPDIATQTQIVQKVETYFAFADEIETQVKTALEKVNLLTQSILTKAFSGGLSAAWRNSQVTETQGNV